MAIMIKFVYILQFFILLIVVVSMITTTGSSNSDMNSTLIAKNESTNSTIEQSNSPATISTTLTKNETKFNSSSSDVKSPLIEPMILYHRPASQQQSSKVFYDDQNTNQKITKIIYDEDDDDVKRDIAAYLKHHRHHQPSSVNYEDPYDEEGEEEAEPVELEDVQNLVGNNNHKGHVVNIIEVKRHPSDTRPPPETIIFRGRRFRLYRPDNIHQRKLFLPSESAKHTLDYPEEYYHGGNHKDKKIVSKTSLPSPHLAMLPASRPKMAKIYWRRIIYPSQPTQVPRPKRKTILFESEEDNDDVKPKKIERYVVYYRKRKNNVNNKNGEKSDQLMATSSDRSSNKIPAVAADTDDEDGSTLISHNNNIKASPKQIRPQQEWKNLDIPPPLPPPMESPLSMTAAMDSNINGNRIQDILITVRQLPLNNEQRNLSANRNENQSKNRKRHHKTESSQRQFLKIVKYKIGNE